MSRITTMLACATLLVAATGPLAASDANGRTYSLHTLDYRVAETLVWEICDQNGGKSQNCRVQHAAPGGLNVHATQDVHAKIVRMLVERDERVPASLLFEIVLVRLVDNGGKRAEASLAPHQKRALEAIWEIFPGKRAEILDTGLIRTASEGQTRLGSDQGDSYDAALQLRSTVGGHDGLTFTVDLTIAQRHAGGDSRILASSLSIGEGETVVAGSSRTGGETAVVVLLTSKARG